MSLLNTKFSKRGLRVETFIDESGKIITKCFKVNATISFLYKYGDIYTSEVITFDNRRVVSNGILSSNTYTVFVGDGISEYKFKDNFTRGTQNFLSKNNNISIAETFKLKKVDL